MSRKATHAEVEERVTEVYILLIRGASRADILRHAADRWHLATRQAEDYLARANARLRELASFIHEEELGKARERLNDLYSKNYRVQSYRDALACQKELNELLGLYPVKTERHEHSGPGGAPIQIERILDPHELVARLRDELAAGEEAPALGAPDPEPPGRN
ncbi:MAG: hypothetical protein EDX89_14395 [Acidobacteria bacterium]|nr:MAG: hypothetical protein EDX89_14395 [Acidobacteriota bacterium]MCE7957623.1 hypothetical protein [Acidobacteria bacterium ACB2]